MYWRSDMRENILLWNSLYPLDRFFRKKYKIPFGSKKHLDSNLIDMFFDLFEDTILEHELEEHEAYKENLKAVKRGELRGVKREDTEAEDSFTLLASQFFSEDVLRNLEEK